LMSWEDLERLVPELAARMGGYKPDAILGVRRGGEVLARQLQVYVGGSLYFVDVRHYEGDRRLERVEVGDMPELSEDKVEVLVVDDLIDSGETVAEVVRRLQGKRVKVAVLAVKPWSCVTPDFYVFETERWVVFPWEVGEYG